MQEALTVYVPGEIRLMLNRTKEELSRDLRLNSALMFFWLGKLSSGAAAELAGLPRVLFLDLCNEYGIPVSQIDAADLRRELEDMRHVDSC
jgi:predicted HTH domain antitoxin